MAEKRSKSKIITVKMRLHDISQDPYFFEVPGEISEPNALKEVVLKKYFTETGILEGVIDGEQLILQWYPETVSPSAETLHFEATQLAKSKQYSEATDKWEQAVSLNPDDAEYVYKLGLMYFEQKKFNLAVEYLEKSVSITPIHFRAHLLLGIIWMKLRKFENAEKHVLQSKRLNSANLLSYLNLGAIYSIQKRFNEAIDMFNETIKLSPKEARAYLGLARIYNMLNDIDAANNFYRKVIELAPGTQMAEYAKRSIQITARETEKSDVPMGSGTENNREKLFTNGMGAYLSGDYRLSADYYKSYLNGHPSDDYAWYLLGESKIRSGELNEAADCVKRAIRLNGKRGIYYKSLGIILHYMGKSKEVTEVLKKAMELGKKDGLVWTIQGINSMRQRKLEDAIQQFKESLKKNPNNPFAMYHLALAYFQTGERDKAFPILESILSYDYFLPIKSQAKSLLARMESIP
jgi:tetratricopeptide (TPR) repeat protein